MRVTYLWKKLIEKTVRTDISFNEFSQIWGFGVLGLPVLLSIGLIP